MRLSEAIRLGAMLKPQARGAFNTGSATCAMGAAYEACPPDSKMRLVTGPLDIFGSTQFRGARAGMGEMVLVVNTHDDWRDVMWRVMLCPVCATVQDVGNRLIPHLNDDHLWTREQIADWVDQVERALVAATPVQVDCVAAAD